MSMAIGMGKNKREVPVSTKRAMRAGMAPPAPRLTLHI